MASRRPVGPALTTLAPFAAGAAAVYLAVALIPAIGLIERGWQVRRYSQFRAIPWADLAVVYVGAIAAAAAAAPAGRILSPLRALGSAAFVHAVGAALTGALCAFVIVPLLPGGAFQGVVEKRRGMPMGAGYLAWSVAPYVIVQFALGMAVALLVRWSSAPGRRLVRGPGVAGPGRVLPPARDVALALLGAVSFLVVDAAAIAAVGLRLPRHEPSFGYGVREAVALWSIPVGLGTMAAAAFADAIARARSWRGALALGALVQFLAAFCFVPLATLPSIARVFVEPSMSLGDAVAIGTARAAGGRYGAIILVTILPGVQSVFGSLSALFVWTLMRADARSSVA